MPNYKVLQIKQQLKLKLMEEILCEKGTSINIFKNFNSMKLVSFVTKGL